MDILSPNSLENNPEKCCSSCGNSFPATPDFFHRNKANTDGLNGRCKACIKEYQNRPGVREHILAKKEVYRNLPEIKERERARQKVYNSRSDVQERNRIRDRERHRRPNRQAWRRTYYSRPDVRQHVSEYNKVYKSVYYSQTENHEHKLAQDRLYHQTHIERHRELGRVSQHRRRAKKRSILGIHTPAQIQDLLYRQRYKCYYCRKKFKKANGKYIYHVDHTFPIHRVAGTDIPANDISYLVLACPACNISKGDKFPWEWHQGGRLL